jgi:hypothetical protein
MRRPVVCAAVIVGLVSGGLVSVLAQRGGVFRASRDHPAIAYTAGPLDNAVSRLNEQLRDGSARLDFDSPGGTLRSVLDALDIPVESQLAVFSKTSFQAPLIGPVNPRAIYFTDDVAAAWVRNGSVIEVAAHDRRQGVAFYTLDLAPAAQGAPPQFARQEHCLSCHLSWDTLGVPGLQVQSVAPFGPRDYATGFVSDHRSRLEDRWGGWYVTGTHGGVAHMGNVEVTDVEDPRATVGKVPPVLASLDGVFDLDGYLTPHSDIVALMVLEHQAHMTNLMIRLGWETRRILFRAEAAPPAGGPAVDPAFLDVIREAAAELVDYLLFVDEQPLRHPIEGTAGFTDLFSARGPFDSRGRSLHQLDLERRLLRYPCSYMIYTDAFDALPDLAREAIYQRMWEILSGEETGDRYAGLGRVDREAVVEILRETKGNLPSYFTTGAR